MTHPQSLWGTAKILKLTVLLSFSITPFTIPLSFPVFWFKVKHHLHH